MKLLDKYRNLYAMYVEYPHKSIWNANFTHASVRQAVEEHVTKLGNPPMLLYVHIPFCKRQCYYCTCHTTITNNYDRVKDYLKYLYAEIELIHVLFREYGTKPNIKEIHLGGLRHCFKDRNSMNLYRSLGEFRTSPISTNLL